MCKGLIVKLTFSPHFRIDFDYNDRLRPPEFKMMEPNLAPNSPTHPAVVNTHEKSNKTRTSWSVINFALDLLLFSTFVILFWLSALTQFVFPAGATGASWQLFGGSLESWHTLQFWVLCAFAIEVLIHIMLHWSWVCGVVESQFFVSASGKRTKGNDGRRTLVGVILLAATMFLLGAGLGIAACLLRRVE
jgi:hypothetical protein